MIKQEIKEMSLDELKVNLKDKKSLLEDLRFQKALQKASKSFKKGFKVL